MALYEILAHDIRDYDIPCKKESKKSPKFNTYTGQSVRSQRILALLLHCTYLKLYVPSIYKYFSSKSATLLCKEAHLSKAPPFTILTANW